MQDRRAHQSNKPQTAKAKSPYALTRRETLVETTEAADGGQRSQATHICVWSDASRPIPDGHQTKRA